MDSRFLDQLQRIDRLLTLVNSGEPDVLLGVLTYHDLLVTTFGEMWMFRQWLVHDPTLHACSTDVLRSDIYQEWCIVTCGDIAEGRVLLTPGMPPGVTSRPRSAFAASWRGIRYYVDMPNHADPYHGALAQELLAETRSAWQKIVDKHWLSDLPF
ncbi:MAG TPA: hypothetical protein VE967_04210 [Gemmatimonadaceae bacterium]|nr:hypothetical protein [Gemmatimonadaceae bacterium]